MWIDTHAHLVWPELKEKVGEILNQCREAQVDKIITVACDLETLRASAKLVQETADFDLYYTAGMHPSDIRAEGIADWSEFISHLTNPLCKAIGECGLDYFHAEDTSAQEGVFRRQIELAQQYQKPLIIHTRQASEDTWRILSDYTNLDFVIHCFTENKEFAKKVLDRGGMISLTGILTFPKSQDLQELVKYLPLEHIML
nr:TatD family hydrolase [Candidatus Gracilibacteria bacterium]